MWFLALSLFFNILSSHGAASVCMVIGSSIEAWVTFQDLHPGKHFTSLLQEARVASGFSARGGTSFMTGGDVEWLDIIHVSYKQSVFWVHMCNVHVMSAVNVSLKASSTSSTYNISPTSSSEIPKPWGERLMFHLYLSTCGSLYLVPTSTCLCLVLTLGP